MKPCILILHFKNHGSNKILSKVRYPYKITLSTTTLPHPKQPKNIQERDPTQHHPTPAQPKLYVSLSLLTPADIINSNHLEDDRTHC